MSSGQTEKITALYERLSRDDEKSKVHTHKLLLSGTCESCRIFY